MLPTIPTTIDIKTVCDAVFQEVVESHKTNGRCTFMGKRLSEAGDMEFFYFTDLDHTPIPADVRILDWYTKVHRADADGDKRCANSACTETGCALKCATCVDTCASFYCSPGCQKQHWPTHRLECRKLMSARDFWHWYMTGKCSILHSAVCELLEIIRDTYHYDTVATMPDGTTKRVVKSKLAEPARIIKGEMVELVSVYDVPLQKIRGQGPPRLDHYSPANVDRLMHSVGLGCSAAHPARCADPSHIGLHQMLALQLESDTDAGAVMLLDLAGAQFGVGLDDLADRGNYLQTYHDEAELNAAGFVYVENSDFKDSGLWHSRQIRDPVKESAAQVLYHLVKTCKKKLNLVVKGAVDRALARDPRTQHYLDDLPLAMRQQLAFDDDDFIARDRVSDDRTLSNVGDYVCGIVAEKTVALMHQVERATAVNNGEPAYEKSEIFYGVDPTMEVKRRIFRLCVRERTRGLASRPAVTLSGPEGQKISMYAGPDGSLHRLDTNCNACGSVSAKKKCSRCGLVHYCNIQCQKSDWVYHKTVCRVAENQ